MTSNYCYHNITGADKQKLLLETLRALKRGKTFSIHGSMSRYGDMDLFVKSLLDQGYQKVELIDTTKGMFMTLGGDRIRSLSGSTILTDVNW